MSAADVQIMRCSIVEDEVQMTTSELCHATNTEAEYVIAWVYEGILSPSGSSPDDWRFSGNSLLRAKKALTLSRDLGINTPGVALALDLLDELSKLKI